MPNTSHVVKLLKNVGVKTMVIVPMRLADNLIGRPSLSATVPNAFTPEHIEMAQKVAHSPAVAI
jgi:GAF domain-containing protein